MHALAALTTISSLALGRVADGSIVDDSPLVVLYYENWAGWVRNFSPSHLENNFLSREYPVRNWVINYAFFAWNPQECSLQNVDTVDLSNQDKGGWAAADWNIDVADSWETSKPAEGQLIAFMKLRAKYPYIKLMPSIGGWSRSHTYYDCLINKMDHMVDSVVDHVIAWGWDGIDLDWEYPSCDGAPCGCQNEAVCAAGTGLSNKAGAGDWGRYKEFVKKVRSRFDELEDKLGRRLYISAALGMNPKIIDGGNEVWSEGAPYEWFCDEDDFDWLNMMTYDYYGPWAAQTGPLAPLYPNPDLEGDQMSVDDSVTRILKKCKKPWKLNMGLATYGKTWQSVPKEGDVPGLWQSSTAEAGQITSGGTFERGTVSYFDMKKNVLPGCTRTWDDVSKTPTAYCDTFPTATDIPYDDSVGPVPRGQPNTFVSYEDGESWKEKMSYARNLGMAGGIIWAASDTGNDQSWSLESTHDLMSGLFEGWFGQKMNLNESPNPFHPSISVTKWATFPCPIATKDYIHDDSPSDVSRCAGATFDPSNVYLHIPVDSNPSSTGKDKMMIHPIGGAPTSQPNPPEPTTIPQPQPEPTTQPQPEPSTTRSTTTTTTTTTRPTTTTTTTTRPTTTTTTSTTTTSTTTTTRPRTTTPAPNPNPVDDPVSKCEKMVKSPGNPDWEADCREYCGYIFNTSWCPDGSTGESLAACVVSQKVGQCYTA